jgi:peptidoglycan/LPS O-acetylase OafA/YrhL
MPSEKRLWPLLAGAVVGAFRKERRKRGKRKLILSVLMSAMCGCGLAPLFAHVFSIPDPVASSLAFFLGVWGLEGIDVVQNVLRFRFGEMGEPEARREEARQKPDA